MSNMSNFFNKYNKIKNNKTMTKEEFVNKYVSEHYPNLHADLQNIMGGE